MLDAGLPFFQTVKIFLGIHIVRAQLGDIESPNLKAIQCEIHIPDKAFGQFLFKVGVNEDVLFSRIHFVQVFDRLQETTRNVGLFTASDRFHKFI